jgi:nicotinamide mononucleotide (NMN) deamidase PncC
LANWLSEVDPEGTVFLGGTVMRQDRLALPLGSSDSPQTGVSGPDAVGDLAQRTREQLGASFALAVGPFPTSDHPTPTVNLALASADGVVTHEVGFTGHPAILKARCTKQALNLLRLRLRLL